MAQDWLLRGTDPERLPLPTFRQSPGREHSGAAWPRSMDLSIYRIHRSINVINAFLSVFCPFLFSPHVTPFAFDTRVGGAQEHS